MTTKLWMTNCRRLPSRSIGKVMSIAVQINAGHLESFEHHKTKLSQVESGLNQTLPFATHDTHGHSPLTPLLVPRSSIGTTVIFGFSSMPMSLRSCESGCFCRCRRCGNGVNGSMGQWHDQVEECLKYMTNMLYIVVHYIILYYHNILSIQVIDVIVLV